MKGRCYLSLIFGLLLGASIIVAILGIADLTGLVKSAEYINGWNDCATLHNNIICKLNVKDANIPTMTAKQLQPWIKLDLTKVELDSTFNCGD